MFNPQLQAKTAKSLVAALVAALLAAGCAPDVPVTPGTPGQPVAVAPSAPPAAGEPQRTITGEASIFGQPFAGAAISIVDHATRQNLIGNVQTDALGRFTVDRPVATSPDSLLTVTASKDGVELYTLYVPAGSPLRTQAVAGTFDLTLDIATAIATKKALPQLQEVMASLSGTPASTQRLAALVRQFNVLVTAVAAALATPPNDQRAHDAILAVTSHPGIPNVETLGNVLIGYSDLSTPFAVFVGAAHQALVSNITEGGPVVQPGPWHAGPLIITGPQVVISGTTVTITADGATTVITTTPAAIASGAASVSVVSQSNTAVRNDPPPAASGGSGAGSSSGVAGGVSVPGTGTPVDGRSTVGNPIGAQ